MEYIVEYTRKNGKLGKKIVEADSFSDVSIVVKQTVRDFSHIFAVSAK